VLGSELVCVTAEQAWDWATPAADPAAAAGASGAGSFNEDVASGGEAGQVGQAGAGGAHAEANVPDDCPSTVDIRWHLETKYPMSFDNGTRKDDQCCYGFFQPCG
jgi:hypothetical protein